MKKKIMWLVVSCLMVTALVLASCAPAAVEEEEVVPPSEKEEEEAPPTEQEEKAEEEVEMVTDSLGRLVEKPKYGGMLKYAYPSPVGFDDCIIPGYLTSTLFLTNEELVTGDWTKGPAGTGEVTWQISAYIEGCMVGSLAESWEVPDHQTIIYHIRKGIHWHNKPPLNGRELVADDVVYSIKRQWEEPRSYNRATYPPPPESVTAPDKYTVVVKLEPHGAGAKFEIISDYIYILPPEPIEEHGNMNDWRVSCGTGAFMLVDYVRDSSVTFVRNPNYWKNDPLHPKNQLPYLDGVKYIIIPDYSTALSAVRTGKLDILGNISWEDIESLTRTTPDLQRVNYLGNEWLVCMRVDAEPFDDIRVRRALAMAVNNQEINDTYYGGNAEVLAWPLMPMPEFSDMYWSLDELPESIRELYEYHPDKARQLLSEAGYPDGFKTHIDTAVGTADILSIYKAYWADIGVDLEIKVHEAGVYWSMANAHTHTQMIYHPGAAFLPWLMVNWQPGARFNCSIVDDERCNEAYRLVNEYRFEEAKRCQVYRELIPYVLDQAWYIQTPSAYYYRAWWPWVKGYHGEFTPGLINFNQFIPYIWVDQDLKEKMTGTR